ncbi:MAG: hypothetical protein U9M90_01245 [Patescibacteria group bacterium]|nr:hypothetical protein [Patescibacteria group bacterium]
MNQEQEGKILNLIEDERGKWEDGEVFVTKHSSFLMTNIVEKSRKNYYGFFTEEKDPSTGRQKIFVPFTEWTVETVRKNTDIDTKDLEVKARNKQGHLSAHIFRYVLFYYLDKMGFGEKINELLRNVIIDGTSFIKTWEDNGLKMKVVDRLNMTIDPAASSLDEMSGIHERNYLTLPEFKKEGKGWKNMDVQGTTRPNRTGIKDTGTESETEIPYVEITERYGYIPKNLLGKAKDDEYVYALVICSGLGTKEKKLHKVKEVKEHPYSAFFYKKVPSRFDGRGVPEMLFNTQAYLNETINLRLNTARVAQMGLWDIKGSVTPQQLRNLFATGAIKTGLNDVVERIDTGSIDVSSYKDEEQGYLWGQRQTQTRYEDEVDSKRPATNALIQERGASKGYSLIMEGIFLGLAKMVEEKMLPIIKNITTIGDIVRITGNPTDLEKMDKKLASSLVFDEMEKFQKKNGRFPFYAQEQIDEEILRVMEELGDLSSERYVKMSKDFFDLEVDIKVSGGDEYMNKALVAQNLNNTLALLAKMGVPPNMLTDVTTELFDTLGLDGESLSEKIGQVKTAEQTPQNIQALQTETPQVEANQLNSAA